MDCIATNPDPTLGLLLIAGCACLAAIWLFGVYLPKTRTQRRQVR